MDSAEIGQHINSAAAGVRDVRLVELRPVVENEQWHPGHGLPGHMDCPLRIKISIINGKGGERRGGGG